MKYKEKSKELGLNKAPPRIVECPDCGKILNHPELKCEFCKIQITYKLTHLQYAG